MNEVELTAFYRSNGFHDVKVARELQFSHDGREIDVVFHVVEGVRSVPAEDLEAINKVKADDVYKQADADVKRIVNYNGSGREVRVISADAAKLLASPAAGASFSQTPSIPPLSPDAWKWW